MFRKSYEKPFTIQRALMAVCIRKPVACSGRAEKWRSDDLVGFGPKCPDPPGAKEQRRGERQAEKGTERKNSAGNRKKKSREVSGKKFCRKICKKNNT